MSALAIVENESPALSLDLPEGQTFEEWERTGRELGSASKVLNWWIGDWWAAGSHRYGARAEAAASGIFGKEFQTLRIYGTVCRSFKAFRRRNTLSFSHHQEVCALKPVEADRLLDDAERYNWSTRELREAVQRHRGVAAPAGENIRSFFDRIREPIGYDRDQAKESIYRELHQAAVERRICPTADTLMEASGVSSVSTTVALMHSLQNEGRINVERFQKSRIVTITETGDRTATPNDRTPHWRDIRGEAPAPSIEAVKRVRPDIGRQIMLEAHRLNKEPGKFLIDLVIIGWEVWEERLIQVGASEGLI